MFGTFLRILIGLVFAYLAAAATKILFAYPPGALQNMTPEQTSAIFSFIPKSATHMAIFSLPMALAVLAIGEWRRWRDWAFYAASAIILSLVGFFALYYNEPATQGWSLTSSNYPLITFLTTGFVGGLVYWLFSGRLAGGPHAPVRNGQPGGHMQRPVQAHGNRH
jgi:hypothetical protein